MRFTNFEKSGLQRLQESRKYHSFKEIILPPKEESQDTIIRRDINRIIKNMISKNTEQSQIREHLKTKYPNYSEYIEKMILHHFNKMKKSQISNSKEVDVGDER